MKKSQRSLKAWTDQKWRTKSGKPSLKTGERYLPEKAIKALSDEEYRRTTRAKRAAMRKGKQVSKQPKSISKKTASYRKFSQEINMAVDKKAIAAMDKKISKEIKSFVKKPVQISGGRSLRIDRSEDMARYKSLYKRYRYGGMDADDARKQALADIFADGITQDVLD